MRRAMTVGPTRGSVGRETIYVLSAGNEARLGFQARERGRPLAPERASRCSHQGFTLVELLVVIGVIAVLLAILLPVLSKAREQARAVKCASNMRQIAVACLMYAQENRERLPVASMGIPSPAIQATNSTYSWTDGTLWTQFPVSPDTRRQIFNCPSDGADPRIAPTGDPRNFSYNFNETLAGNNIFNALGWGVRLSEIHRPSQKIIVLEEENPWNEVGEPTDTDKIAFLTRRHSKTCNEGFADGHVERMDPYSFLDKRLVRRHFYLRIDE